MVAVHASVRYGERPVQPHKVETQVGCGKIEGASGTNWLRCGLVRKIGRVKEKDQAPEDKDKFAPFALDCVKLSTIHRTNTEKGKTVDDKAPRVLRPADTIVHGREEGPTVQLLGDSGMGHGSMASSLWV